MKYKCLRKNEYSNGEFGLVPLRYSDIMLIKEWRNNQMTVLRQRRPLTDEDQRKYYKNTIEQSFLQRNPSIILFSYLHCDTCVGYGGLTNIIWESKRAEMSFLLKTDLAYDPEVYEKYFDVFLTMLKKVAFEELDINRIYTETYDIRPLHVRILERQGFKLEGRLKKHVMIDSRFVDSLLHGCLKSI